MNPKKAGYRKGTNAVAGDVGRIASNTFWGVILGGAAGGLAARSWRGAIIGMLSTTAITVGVMGGRATIEGRWIGSILAAASAAGAFGLSFAVPEASTSPPSASTSMTTPPLSTAGLGRARVLIGPGARRVYGTPMSYGVHRG